MKDKILKYFWKKGYFRLASYIYLTLTFIFGLFFIYYLLNSMILASLLRLGFAMICYSLYKLLKSKDKEIWWREYEKSKI